MRLLVAFPLTGIPEEAMLLREKKIKEVLGADVQVEIKTIAEGPASIESKSEEIAAAYQLFKMLEDVATIEETYDGMLIWCAGDPGVEALREQFNIPVVGPGQAMITIANLLSSRYGMICPSSGDAQMIKNLFYHLGLEHRLAITETLDMSVLDLKTDPDQLVERLSSVAREMMANQQIESVLLGCLGFFDIGKRVEEEIKIPVIDPGVVGLHVLKMMVQANLSFSRKKYPPLRKGKLFHD